ncbi:hypothetical protein ACFE04_021543 [Oxalis oulophora]
MWRPRKILPTTSGFYQVQANGIQFGCHRPDGCPNGRKSKIGGKRRKFVPLDMLAYERSSHQFSTCDCTTIQVTAAQQLTAMNEWNENEWDYFFLSIDPSRKVVRTLRNNMPPGSVSGEIVLCETVPISIDTLPSVKRKEKQDLDDDSESVESMKEMSIRSQFSHLAELWEICLEKLGNLPNIRVYLLHMLKAMASFL